VLPVVVVGVIKPVVAPSIAFVCSCIASVCLYVATAGNIPLPNAIAPAVAKPALITGLSLIMSFAVSKEGLFANVATSPPNCANSKGAFIAVSTAFAGSFAIAPIAIGAATAAITLPFVVAGTAFLITAPATAASAD